MEQNRKKFVVAVARTKNNVSVLAAVISAVDFSELVHPDVAYHRRTFGCNNFWLAIVDIIFVLLFLLLLQLIFFSLNEVKLSAIPVCV